MTIEGQRLIKYANKKVRESIKAKNKKEKKLSKGEVLGLRALKQNAVLRSEVSELKNTVKGISAQEGTK